MNEWNRLETRLACWKPRKPSPRIKRALFEKAAGTAPSEGRSTRRWMGPAMAFCVISAALLTSPEFTNFPWSEGGTNGYWEGVVLTNPSFAAYIPGDSHSEHNPMMRSVQYAVRGEAASALNSSTSWKTNKIIR